MKRIKTPFRPANVRRHLAQRAEDLAVELASQKVETGRLIVKLAAPIPMLIWCPQCGKRHIDGLANNEDGTVTDWASKPHHTHACQGCGFVWRHALVNTVGVRFLPGFKNDGLPA